MLYSYIISNQTLKCAIIEISFRFLLRIFFYQILYNIEIKNIFFRLFLAFEDFKHRAKIIEKRKKKNHSFFFDFESIKISTGSTLCQ